MTKKIITLVVTLAVTVSLLGGIQQLVIPKYMDNVLEGAFIREYYQETTPHDVIMVGDCEVYENFSPVELWKEYGITSYIRGSAQQLIWQSYYLLEDTLRYETPKVVVFNVQALMHNTPQKEEYNRMTLDGMKWSKSKYDAIQASMMPEESMWEYIFPLLRYHSRITELEKSDVTYFWNKRKVTHNGYYMRTDCIPYDKENALEESKPENTEFGANAWLYMDKIKDLCASRGIKLLLVKAPSLSPVWFDEYEEQVQDYAKKNDLPYINYLKLKKKVKLSYKTDTYDGGLHMNLSGARKLSHHIGSYLQKEFSLADHRQDEKYQTVWKEKIAFYNQMIEDQKKELETYGYLKSFGGEAEKKAGRQENTGEEDKLEEDLFGGF